MLSTVRSHGSVCCRKFMKSSATVLKKALIIAVVSLVVCEYLIYPIVLYQCFWPEQKQDGRSRENETLRAMILADTHLLGPFRGHWFDKLRREWQMHRAFQTAMTLFQPEAVFFLGDVFDEGNWVNEEGFKEYVNRFHQLFSVKENGKTRSFVVTGNHDMGFHYEIIPYLHHRFNKAFNASSVRLLKLKGSNFLMLNSMAMEMDGCFLCSSAMKSLLDISKTLECEKNPDLCSKYGLQKPSANLFSSPVLLQHFPMYRKSDETCKGEDAAPENEKVIKFRESYDCLSKDSSDFLFQLIKPRLILSGHTHHHCITEHLNEERTEKLTMEYSVPSFSWRNRNDPSFYLAIFTPGEYNLSKCYMPKESTVYFLYSVGGIILMLWLIFSPYNIRRKLANWSRKASLSHHEE
ncbi:Metallophosphoesterase 1 [Orchesella cincta]|uniref:Metallophosphoesterase 1 n=1 Tax=Orchesella cincta TaxID=48709 RepID=A0A1D2NFJ1_ORCCI|nr:Metallophosphoesterase 1 [Orchesella cincta]